MNYCTPSRCTVAFQLYTLVHTLQYWLEQFHSVLSFVNKNGSQNFCLWHYVYNTNVDCTCILLVSQGAFCRRNAVSKSWQISRQWSCKLSGRCTELYTWQSPCDSYYFTFVLWIFHHNEYWFAGHISKSPISGHCSVIGATHTVGLWFSFNVFHWQILQSCTV